MVLEATYDFLFVWLENQLGGLPSLSAEMLYAQLRSTIPDHAAEVWLYAIVDDQGFYIPDNEQKNRALARLLAGRGSSAQSPVHLLGNFLVDVIPLDLLFSYESIHVETGLVDDFKDAKYNPEMGGAEQKIYQAPGLRSQPLVTDGRIRLVAGYPDVLTSEIQEQLLQNRESFRSIINSSRSDLHGRLAALLKLKEESDVTSSFFEAVEMKPGFGGFSIDMKLVGRHLKNWLSQRRSRKL